MLMKIISVLAVVAVAAASDCESVSNQSDCTKMNCSWCTSGAVGDSCVSPEDAAALPASVFSCTDAEAARTVEKSKTVKNTSTKAPQDQYYFLSTSDCEAVSDQSSCLASSGCSWCESGAVGSSCMSTEDASALPASVFSCTDAEAARTVKKFDVEAMFTQEAPVAATTCASNTDNKSCLAASEGNAQCAWCTSGAVGDSCYSQSDAQDLPSSIFDCNYGFSYFPEEEKKGLTLGASDKGVDISQPLSGSTADCFASNGISYVIPRGYRSSGSVDPNACASLKAAQASGISKREVYMFPCPTCSSSPSQQMSQLTSALGGCSSAFTGRIWLDIEGSQYWKGSSSANRDWYQGLVDACKSSGFKCGVYSSYYQWQGIFGSTDYAYGSDLPLWYAHYDNSASFSDFQSFGNWKTPTMKQYQGDVSLCGMGVDLDYGS